MVTAAVPDEMDTQLHLREVSVEVVPAAQPPQAGDPDVTCSEDGSRCLSREEVRALGRRVISERQRMIELLAAYDSQQLGPASSKH